MNTLTAIRTFAAPGFTPTKGTKIFNERWYMVRMQNIEHGQGDYMGLGEGEYVELLPGKAARERREARLNHCNSIVEYNGPVFEFFANEYGGEGLRSMGFYASPEAASAKLEEKKAAHEKWVCACIESALNYYAKAGVAKLNDARGTFIAGRYTGGELCEEYNIRYAEEAMAVAAKRCNGFRCDFKIIR